MSTFRTYTKLSEVLRQEVLAPSVTVDPSKKLRELLDLFQDQSQPVKPPYSAEIPSSIPYIKSWCKPFQRISH